MRFVTVCLFVAAVGSWTVSARAADVDPMMEAVARELLRQATSNAQRASVLYEAASGAGDDNKALRAYLNERALGLPGKTELAILNAKATRRAEAYKKLTALEGQYKTNPTDAALRRKLACLWIIDLDYAYRASSYTSKTEGSWYTCPRLAGSSMKRFYDPNKAKLVGDWYFKEVAPLAGPQTRPDMLRRAKTYYEHALALGTKALRKTTPKADRKTTSKGDRTSKLSQADREEIAAALAKITAELNGEKKPEWQIIFRSDDATVWNTDRPTGMLSFAVPLSKVGGPVRYLKLTRRDTSQFVIIPINAMSLDRATSIGKTYGWQGEKYNYGGKATCVGIYSRTLRKSSQRVCITYSYTGWGFGYHRPTKAQGWVWAGKTIDKTSFEIAVFNGDLTPEEAKVLLQ